MNACCVYDFTLPANIITVTDLQTKLFKTCKKWDFQKEKGNPYEHYQGRLSLKTKKRLNEVIEYWNIKETHFSITSNANKKNNFYVLKDETRIEGPWSDETYDPIYIPRQIREISTLYPWQERIIEISKIWDTRRIHIIIDQIGNIGKTILKTYIRCHRLGRIIPHCNNYKDILRIVCDMPTSNCYIIDMPRALEKDKLSQLYSAIETIKDGYAYDDRYSFKEKIFDCPNIFVFTNSVPDTSYMSKDRWAYWRVKDHNLYKLEPECLITES